MLDFTTTLMMPEALDFEPVFEPSRQSRHKYVIDGNNGEVLGHVGDTFTCASHRDFFEGVWSQITENLNPDDIEGADIHFKAGRSGGFGMMDVRFPSISTKIATEKHETELQQRIIALHSIDGGSGSNTTLFGTIDMFCTNGCVSGEHSQVRRRNSSNFSMESFIKQLRTSKNDFYLESERLQVFAQTALADDTVRALLNSLMASKIVDEESERETKATKMFDLYQSEAQTRGKNKFALMSAFTNYATFADDRNGFKFNKRTLSENRAANMVSREIEVNKWLSDDRFLEAA